MAVMQAYAAGRAASIATHTRAGDEDRLFSRDLRLQACWQTTTA